ncbi:MAG: HD domain-containing protein [Eubacterium sp.]|nr:HD domain-containing protein [Eubacterium sp.]
MVVYYYLGMFIVSIIMSLIYLYNWQRHFDVNITAIFVIVPIINITYFLLYTSHTLETAILSLKIIYIGGAFLPWFVTMCAVSLCKIKIKRMVRLVTLMLSAVIYGFTLTIGHSGLFYKSITLEEVGGISIHHKVYGPMHTVFYVLIILYMIASLAAIYYGYTKKNLVSRRILLYLLIPELVTMVAYFSNRFLGGYIELMPMSYVFGQVMYMLIVQRISLYDVSDMVIESMVQSGDTAFITMDFDHNYLGCNKTAREIFPELSELTIDYPVSNNPALEKNILHWVEHFEEDENVNRNLYIKHFSDDEKEDKIYIVSVNYLYDGRKRRGYQIFLSDDTKNQKYIKLLDKYNDELEEEVDKKTQHIVEMHNNLILGMATMVESRDNSTGGHIKRTSVGVKLIIDEIIRDPDVTLPEQFCKDIVKAAPMHDIGKIAVDDAVLRKPGRFTPEEFNEMKKHAGEGARIIREILKDTDDENFKKIAENVAHYHHERWDGSGYPEKLVGEKIPLEARIMAIADVYDALVSKRCYKDSMSFEAAFDLIEKGMGTQFDPSLEKFFLAARKNLESYYSNLEEISSPA